MPTRKIVSLFFTLLISSILAGSFLPMASDVRAAEKQKTHSVTIRPHDDQRAEWRDGNHAAKDTYITNSNPSDKHGSEQKLSLRDVANSSGRAIMEFDLTRLPGGTSIPQDATITRAALRLHTKAFIAPDRVSGSIARLDVPQGAWNEDEANWYQYANGKPWNREGGDYDRDVAVRIDGAAVSHDRESEGIHAWVDFEVKSLVQDAVRRREGRAQFFIKDVEECKFVYISWIKTCQQLPRFFYAATGEFAAEDMWNTGDGLDFDKSPQEYWPSLTVEYTLPEITTKDCDAEVSFVIDGSTRMQESERGVPSGTESLAGNLLPRLERYFGGSYKYSDTAALFRYDSNGVRRLVSFDDDSAMRRSLNRLEGLAYEGESANLKDALIAASDYARSSWETGRTQQYIVVAGDVTSWRLDAEVRQRLREDRVHYGIKYITVALRPRTVSSFVGVPITRTILEPYQSIAEANDGYFYRADEEFTGFAGRLEDNRCRIWGVKFHDKDGDSRRSSDEPGLGNWTIELFGEEGDRKLATARTSRAGSSVGFYEFLDLNGKDKYRIREVQKSGWRESTDLDSYQTPNRRPRRNVGNDNKLNRAVIQGYKFNDNGPEDQAGNGRFDDSERGLNGWEMQLYEEGKTQPIRTARTATSNNRQGFYQFTGLDTDKKYRVLEVMKAGWTQTSAEDSFATPRERKVRNIGNAQEEKYVRFCAVDSTTTLPLQPIHIRPKLGASFFSTAQGDDAGCTRWLNTSNQGFATGSSYMLTAEDRRDAYATQKQRWTRTSEVRQTVRVTMRVGDIIAVTKLVSPEIIDTTNSSFTVMVSLEVKKAGVSQLVLAEKLAQHEDNARYFEIDTSVAPLLTAPDGSTQTLSATNAYDITHTIATPEVGVYRLQFRAKTPSLPADGTYGVDLVGDSCEASASVTYRFANRSECLQIPEGSIRVQAEGSEAKLILDTDTYIRSGAIRGGKIQIEPNTLVVTGKSNTSDQGIKIENYAIPTSGKLNWEAIKQVMVDRVNRAVVARTVTEKTCAEVTGLAYIEFAKEGEIWFVKDSCFIRWGDVVIRGKGTIINPTTGDNLEIRGSVRPIAGNSESGLGYIAVDLTNAANTNYTLRIVDQSSIHDVAFFTTGTIRIGVDQHDTSVLALSAKDHEAKFIAQTIEVPQDGPRVTIRIKRADNLYRNTPPLFDTFILPIGREVP